LNEIKSDRGTGDSVFGEPSERARETGPEESEGKSELHHWHGYRGNLKRQSVDIDPNILARGVQDALSGANLLLSKEEIQETMVAFQKEMMESRRNGERLSFPRIRRRKASKPFQAACSIR